MRKSGNETQTLASRSSKISLKAPLWDTCSLMAFIIDELAQRTLKNINNDNCRLFKNKRPQYAQ